MVLVIDAQVAGISGDMLLSSLVDMGAKKSKIIDGVCSVEEYLKGSKIVKMDFEKTVKHGTKSTHLVLETDEKYHERKGVEIQECILSASDRIGLSEKAKVFAKESIRSLLYAESNIHGEPLESVHFHEASSIDTVIDIIGSAIALDDLRLFSDEIISTPVAVGGGTLAFSHGIVSNPASAILEIFRGSDIAIRGGQIKEEITTPTGASLLVNLADRCSEFYPAMKIKSIGYGAGSKNFGGFPNVLKIVQGESTEEFQLDTIQILETNLDDVSGETIGHMIDKLIANGAKDVTVTGGITKKGRPTNLVSVICDPFVTNTLISTLISETGTLGVRIRSSSRYVVPRIVVSVPIMIQGNNFIVRCKIVKHNETIKYFKVESDDVKIISDSLSLSFKETSGLISDEVKSRLNIK
ncbi:MAG: nickel pincer cofactor biosynthesis protein LarC [Thaumarchaeota archaeon]|nr:nickel pincer cofactor biosynthesis protein LarC [Nitrososphaerota archaeon]MDE1831436.1 nickel pincer cofactor biosynthesis protein LarC [Nitrososphaerota archaeon]MDE1841037.1 nickel pincer cofactor biosynthesis protein LarC [Nitrososphaerota archaeon]MDE1877523.1 nickel pincer cofactor biosynthesis protein LarC [Nitrososphaerota archaeon]